MKQLQKVIDFMGDESVWTTMVPDVVIRRRMSRHVQPYPTAYFVDSHWTSRKANSSVVFDPYDHYQKPGTHRFCQTFALMYLLDALPPPVHDYKTYDMYARRFIKKVLECLPSDHPAFSWDSKKKLTGTSEHPWAPLSKTSRGPSRTAQTGVGYPLDVEPRALSHQRP